MLVKIRRLAAQIAEEKAGGLGAPDLDQAEAGPVEVLDRVHVGRRGERAVEAVRPRVVRALDPAADLALGLFDQARTAVAAGVEEDARDAVLVPHGEHAGLADLAHEVGAGLGDERRVAQADPAAVEVVHLPGQDRRDPRTPQEAASTPASTGLRRQLDRAGSSGIAADRQTP